MTKAAELSLIAHIIDTLGEFGSWCGETHIQKTAYVAKVAMGVPIESEFVLYKHGPFSFDLNKLLAEMRAQQIISVTPQGPYGSTYAVNSGMWGALKRSMAGYYAPHDEKIRFVCHRLAKKKVTELERVATAIFVRLHFPGLEGDLLPRKLNELKPHIPLPEARLAFEESRVFLEQKSGSF